MPTKTQGEEVKHTPTPWIVIEPSERGTFPLIVIPTKDRKYVGENCVAEIYPTNGQFHRDEKHGDFYPLGNAMENAAFIVRACNNHQTLVEDLAVILHTLGDQMQSAFRIKVKRDLEEALK